MSNEKQNGKKETGRPNIFRAIIGYFAGVREEFKKVVWPTKEELGSSTLTVFVICGVFALGFWLVDTGFLALLQKVLGITLS
jgi:preprotein translocase subunit SecE